MQKQFTMCQFSSEYFSGFKVEINLEEVKDLNDVIRICKNRLLEVLTLYNFETLKNVAQKTEFHIHTPETLEKAKENPLNVIWICDHIGYE